MDLERDDLQGADDLVVKADERRMEMRRGKIIAVSLTEESGEPAWNYNDE